MNYAVLDIEATGGKVGTEKIIDIAIYKFDGEEVIDQFGSMVNPERSIDKYVQKLTGITEKMVRRAPKFYELAKRVIEITQDCTIVGHGVKFDYRMLRQEFKQLGYDFDRKTLDTLTLSKNLIPEASSHSLGKLCKELGIPVNARHRADGDTRATLELFKILLEKDVNKEIIQSFAVADPKNKKQISKLLGLEKPLPDRTGVFYFTNASGEVYFLKAAKNIKREVNSIFTGTHPNHQRLQSLVNEVKFKLTGSFPIALLKAQAETAINKNLIPPTRLFLDYGIYYTPENTEPLHIGKHREENKLPILFIPTRNKGKKLIDDWQQKFNYDTIKSSTFIHKIRLSIDFPYANFILLDKGRNNKEKSFIEVQNKKVVGYGYYTFYNQLEDKTIRHKLLVHIPSRNEYKVLIKSILKFHKFYDAIPMESDHSIKINKIDDRKR